MLQARDSDLKIKLIRLAKKQHLIRVNYVSARSENSKRAKPFGHWESAGVMLSPALIEIFDRDISADSQDSTACALAYIGPAASNAVPSLLRGMSRTNYSVLPNSFVALSSIKARADLVVPVMLKFLRNTNVGLRDQAISVIVTFGDKAKSRFLRCSNRLMIKAVRYARLLYSRWVLSAPNQRWLYPH